jgi:hypothetical protein
VHVGSPRGVKRWLLEQPTVLTQREVIEIAAAANKPTTWRPSPKATKTVSPAVQSTARLLQAVAGQPCPCGGELVVRTRRADDARFLGCSRFPECRRTWPLESSVSP